MSSPPVEDRTVTSHFTRGPRHGAFTHQLRLRVPEFQTLASSVAGDHSTLPGIERRQQGPGLYSLPCLGSPTHPLLGRGHTELPARFQEHRPSLAFKAVVYILSSVSYSSFTGSPSLEVSLW